MYDLIIVGGGPAGLTAAVYAMRKHLNVLLISQDLGGKTNYHLTLPEVDLPPIIRGVDMVDRFRRELEYLDFVHHENKVSKISKEGKLFTVETEDGVARTALSVIFATGSRVKQLQVPGEQTYVGRGLSYSAVSHAPMFMGRHTVVVGDGDLALRAVAELNQIGATVALVAPTHGALDTPMAKRLINTWVKVVLLEAHKVKAITGNGFVKEVLLETPEGEETTIETDGVFVELGLMPNTEAVKDLVELDEQDRVKIDNRNQTTCPGLFAAGDVTDAFAEQVLISVGEGAKAALGAYEYLLTQN